jgi:hypothetical protein
MDTITNSVQTFGLTIRELVNGEKKKSNIKVIDSVNASYDSVQILILFCLLSRTPKNKWEIGDIKGDNCVIYKD